MSVLQIIFYITGIIFFTLKIISWIVEFAINILEKDKMTWLFKL